MPETIRKSTYRERLNSPYIRRKIYRSKVALPIFLGLCGIFYPLCKYLQGTFGFDPYLGAGIMIFTALVIATLVGEHKANQKFGEREPIRF
jgi:hypothetical protein